MKTIAIIGTGIMGSGMVTNFLKHGYPVIVWNRSEEKLHPLLALGAKRALTPREAAAQADIIFEITADDESSSSVWLGDNGIVASATSGAEKTFVASGTFSVKWIDELIDLCASKSVKFLDMPVTGGRSGAESGQLIMLAGGDKLILDNIRTELSAIAKKVIPFGPIGSGTRFKLILNMLQAIHVAAFGEAMRLAKHFNLDLNAVGEVFTERPGGEVTKTAWQAYNDVNQPTTFSAEWMYKDLRYAQELAEGLDVKFLDDALSKFKKAVDEGMGDKDWTAVNK